MDELHKSRGVIWYQQCRKLQIFCSEKNWQFPMSEHTNDQWSLGCLRFLRTISCLVRYYSETLVCRVCYRHYCFVVTNVFDVVQSSRLIFSELAVFNYDGVLTLSKFSKFSYYKFFQITQVVKLPICYKLHVQHE